MQGFAPLFRMITDRIEAFLADRGYDADKIRKEIEAAGAEAVIPAKVNRRNPEAPPSGPSIIVRAQGVDSGSAAPAGAAVRRS